jgi:hypothetical protein
MSPHKVMFFARVTTSAIAVFVLASGCQTANVLSSLKPGQVAEVHYRRLTCFSSTERVFAFTRAGDGALSMRTAAAEDRKRGLLPARQRPLLAHEVRDIDSELEHARTTRDTDCTTSKEFDLVVKEGARELRRAHLVDASCSGIEVLQALAQE